MTTWVHTDPARRHDFVLLFDVMDGNPNGDPDMDNLPRMDPETMQGLVSDVAIKRKVRNWIDLARGREAFYKIYVQSGTALNDQHKRAYDELKIKSIGSKQPPHEVNEVRAWMCRNFYDIRMFGAVMTTGVNCGQVRGPLQLTFARSIDPINAVTATITRVTVTKPESMKVQAAGEGTGPDKSKQTDMGRKALVPYGLYRAHGFFNPHFAGVNGVTADDLALFWDALCDMWDHDRSAARGLMACRGLYVFSHESLLGNAPAHTLLERVTIERLPQAVFPRAFHDYRVTVDDRELPQGVQITRLM